MLTYTCDDLDRLKKTFGLVPDLVVMTGDLAEWGQEHEFDNAFAFLSGIGDHLGIAPADRHKIAIIPGNHDINRDLAASDFSSRKARKVKGEPFGFTK